MTRNRRGKSLIELVTVIGLMSGLLTATATLLHRVVLAESGARRANDRLNALARAAVAFRADVHGALVTTIADDGRRFSCRRADGTDVEYVIDAKSLTRKQSSVDRPVHWEAYWLHSAVVQFREEVRDGSKLLVMHWQIPTAAVTSRLATDVIPIPIAAAPRLLTGSHHE